MNATSHGASIYEVWLQMVLQGVFAANNWSDEALFSLVGKPGVAYGVWSICHQLGSRYSGRIFCVMNQEVGFIPPGCRAQRPSTTGASTCSRH